MRVLFVAAIAVGLCGQSLYAQTMTEAAAAAAGSTVGGVAGKQVSSGIDKIFGKTGDVLKGAAKQGTAKQDAGAKEPLLKVGPGKPKEDASSVPPPPPPAAGERLVRRAPVAASQAPPTPQPVYVAPTPPPAPPTPAPPAMTRETLASVTAGMSRDELLRSGAPISRVTMFDGGHLVEIYRYQSRDSVLGVVRLSDGAVSKVEVR